MAELVEGFEFRRKGKSTYDPYLDGQVWRVTLEDFPGVASLRNLRAAFHDMGSRRGFKVRTSIDGDSVVLQAYQPEDS